ncbi:SBBP repeat-containing protein [uncultured Paludibaculum sp.]|uniref:SBBP repeat-containing protein n=1 Tax=uncultured Paludibaculum sp. TaxID=1765020 RepID=UPI002AABBBF8|nr:SBBP repeat-containing protein [uncultured Paludibaculum sp.]
MRKIILLVAVAATLAAQSPSENKRLVFSTFNGGDRYDDATAVAVDPNGFIYVAGESESRDIPVTPVGGKPLTSAVFKAYLTKYRPEGKEVLWRAQIGGSSNTVAHAVVLDKDGNIYVAGTTGARDLPLLNPIQDKQPGLNICFVMKFDPAGTLLFSTYFGGERNEEGLALALDSVGNLYLAGRASSTQLPVKNALQPQISGGGQDAFIAKITPDYQLAYATYLGGNSGTDNIYAMAIGPDDSLYVAGETMSTAMATENAYITQPQSYSSFVARVKPEGDGLEYFTYVGWKGGYTKVQGLTVDRDGRAYVVGHTSSKQLPTTENAIQPEFGGGFRDAFLLRLSADGTAAEYLTYLGGSTSGPTDPDETATAVKIDARGFVYVTGFTNSPDFPGFRSLQPDHAGKFDAYLLRLDLEQKQIIYSTFWGGSDRDESYALALGPGEVATIAGVTYSPDLPLSTDALQTKLGSTNDAFVTQVCDPWLGIWFGDLSEARFTYVLGGEVPAPIESVVYAGCPQSFPAEGPETTEPWLILEKDGDTVPMKLKFRVNPEGLAVGEYHTVIKVTVNDAFLPVLEIPVILVVQDPPVVVEEPPVVVEEPPVVVEEPPVVVEEPPVVVEEPSPAN